ncbi:MFS general substrate transporter [Mytilinidion resinicola]|uniref:MFS general substrate transporter n=1 Tax=Mytilinidion resinicola TaxID=574789 RepID=A0A6A6Z8T0_9PEZI|nr:MFS general substrate transporter [Mytilinidion resinicola]KAF2816704.1 MFS general substrate transporter [Mytilinidion resinicola]
MGYWSEVFSSSYGKDKPKFFWWYPAGTSKAEKKLLTKVDFFILSYACLGYFCKWLDQANLSNAFVSGMKEDLHMYGNEFNLANTCFQVGVILGGIPSNLLLTWVPPRYWLPGCELAWGLITIGTYKVTSYNQLYPLRFFLGLLEGTSFVGVQYVLGSWYKRTELGKRTAIFACAPYAGTAFGGYIFSGVKASMDGKDGLAAWRWVFIIDGIITIAVAIYGFIVFPDTPEATTAFYLNPEERQRCCDRLVEDEREPIGDFSWGLFSRVVKSWQFYILTVLWMFWNTTVGKVANTVFQLFLKKDKEHTWSIYQVNNIPTAINGFNIVMVMAANIYADATGRRMVMIMINLGILLFGTICLAIWDIPLGLRIASYLFAGCDGPLSPMFMAWANILCGNDKQVRAMTIAVMNSFGNALTTIIQQFLYPVTDAPKYKKGFPASLAFICGMAGWVFVVRYFELRTLKRKELDGEEVGEIDSQGKGWTGEAKGKAGSVTVGAVKELEG